LWIANLSRYGDNIRRIAETEGLSWADETGRTKANTTEKDANPGGRAMAYPNGVTENGAPGATNPDQGGSRTMGVVRVLTLWTVVVGITTWQMVTILSTGIGTNSWGWYRLFRI